MNGRMLVVLAGLLACLPSAAGAERELILYRRGDLAQAKEKLEAGDEVVRAAFEDVMEDSEKWMRWKGRFSVVDKKLAPASGDKHDYFSLAPYWWPDPEKEDKNGLPYVRKDGKVNPESKDEDATDKERWVDFTGVVQTLALAWYFSGEERFAEKAAEMMRVWFLEEETRMNPNLDHAQAVRGRRTASRSGVLEGRMLFRVMDSVILLESSKAWTEEDGKAFEAWMSEFLTWLTESELGRSEAESPNNHGSWYDAQVMGVAAFMGEEEAMLEAHGRLRGRWATQFEKDGAQPLELERTLSLDYSVFNLLAHLHAWRVAKGAVLKKDLWKDVKSPLAAGTAFLLPALYGEEKWEAGKQIKPLKAETLLQWVRMTERAGGEGVVEEGRIEVLRGEAGEELEESRFQLLLPAE